ncbi:lytic transglycosylase domain-containing protein [Treponema sp. OMZ 305]|uniref:flagellar assembly lytic transglycosylase n=1 Tax=Treponema sp. OMZ 305 TaxID=1659192 RepID=UPI0020A4019D|nr:lytic transglycosylase domain-containing protein [Treponema sp. OMZ 305]UTC56913.1 lytic transglycosylase domain-containing protein [Treponema sp. OMZ 305]
MKFLRSKIVFGKQGRFPRSCLPLFPFRLSLFSLFLFVTSVAACAADKGAVLLKDLKAGNYAFFLKADNAAYRSIKMMGRGSAYYVGLHLKRAGYEQAARFYFALGEKHYEAPLNRLCREALYETGSAAERLESVQKRLRELAGTPAAFGQEDTARAEKEQLALLEIRLLLQTGAYGSITQSPETLYLTAPLTVELVDAFPYFGKALPPFLYKLAEARIAVFAKRYTGAWNSVQEAFGIAHTFAGISSPALLSDIGKAGVYGAENSADAAAFFEDFAAQVRSAAADGQLSGTDMRRCLFYTSFYAARCRTKIGGAAQREQAVKLFLQAAELADSASDFDSATWYYLDAMRMLGLSRYLKALADTAARWKNPAWYADLVQSLRAQLTAAKDWKNLETLHTVLAKTKLPEQRAAVAYTLACAGQLPPDRTARLLQEAAGESHDALYYRILGTYRLGGAQLLEETFRFRSELLSGGRTQSNTSQVQSGAQAQADEANTQSDTGKAQTSTFSPQEARTYIDGLLHFGLYDMVYPRIVAVYPSISAEEALQIARTLASEGRYADSIRVIRFSLKNQEDAATKEQLELLYPRPWGELVSKYAAEYGLPEYLLYALIRSESFFQHQVVSGAGAVGLTQLMPATAADIAKKLKVADYSLTDPEINIRFGAYYLAEMIRRSDNRIMPACFAYNAGISRVRGWQKKAQGLPEDLFLESLEYAETRDYGRKLLSAATVYGTLYYSEKPEDIVRLFFKELL